MEVEGEIPIPEYFYLSDYVLRDPLLFGDFRNACNESEPRYYEDLLDYDAVYYIFLEVFASN